MRGVVAAILGLTLGICTGAGRAGDLSLPPASPAETPLVTLGRPVPLGAAVHQPLSSRTTIDNQLRPAAYTPAGPTYPAPTPPGPELPALSLPASPLPGVPTSPAEQYNCGVVTRTAGTEHPFWEKCKGAVVAIPGMVGIEPSGGRPLFQSDHTFDSFISPISNPFYFEDPRSLTELRPIFFWQGAPRGNPIYHGGDIEYLGLQARLAVTDVLSFTMTKLGEVWMEVHDPTDNFESHAGFAEIILGPKFTFLRSEGTGTVLAAGVNFDIPAGSGRVFQNTGSLSLEPYISAAQCLFHTGYGTFQGLGTFGYNFSVDSERSDNLFLSLHLDFDYGDLHKIYPLIEVNWFYYTSNGHTEPINFEGRDLFNFGARTISGHSDVSLAAGARFKVNESLQLGAALEFPLGTSRSLMDYRVMFDVIFRY
jgi:hypothetical protein